MLCEKLVELKNPKPFAKIEREPLPPDLLLAANQYKDEWAREQVVDSFYEMYSKLGSWDNVRRVAS